MSTPYFSIITVCRNATTVIEETILSVLNQQFKDVEYVVIDGQSTDSTRIVIEKYAEHIQVFHTGKDKGIYDAMNKGVSLASGRYVIFMNAGDVFADDMVLKSIFDVISGADVFFGDAVIDFGGGQLFHKKARSLNNIQRGMICSHQSLVVKRELLQTYPFDLSYKIAADYRQLLACACTGVVFRQGAFSLAKVSSGGISDQRQMKTWLEYIRAVREAFPDQGEGHWPLYLGLLHISIRTLAKKILPASAPSYFRKLRANFAARRSS